jgi:GT2 family glycosyltransferase
MSTFGVGLVAYNMKLSDIEALTVSFCNSAPSYQVVVDNSPTAMSKEYFENLGWTYIHNPKNPGFGASHNMIFDNYAKKADYHLIVNPDVTFSSDVIKKLVDFLDKYQQAGCVMPKVNYPDGRIQRLAKLLPSPIDWIGRRMPFTAYKMRINQRLELHQANYESGIFRVPFVSGCFLLFRSRIIHEIGFFDTRFFMYTEDTDLSRRLWINGTWPYYFGEASVNHGYEKGSSKNIRLLKIHVESALRYFNKWGWIDRQRIKINRECLEQFKL